MNPAAESPPSPPASAHMLLWVRWILGLLLLAVGLETAFCSLVLPDHMASAVTWPEIFCGVLLIPSRQVRTVLVRWILGALFIGMGLNKALHPVDFLKLVRQYGIVQDPYLLNVIAATLPWFEVFCGALLLFGVAVRGAALLLVLMLVPFTSLVLRHALTNPAFHGLPFCSIKFDCGCGAGEVFICRKLVENSLLTLLAGWLVVARGRRLCVRHGLLAPAQPAAA
jgi:uncharacterized membrane protein YphA (DoxX/SURF4 family)